MSARALPARVGHHFRELWGNWWWLVGGLTACYVTFVAAMGNLRIEHVALSVVGLLFAYWGPRTKAFFVAIVPYVLTGVAYDLVRYLRPYFLTQDNVLTCGLERADTALASIGGVSIPEYFSTHHTRPLDLFFAVPYAAYMYVVLALAGYWYFRDRLRMKQFLWAFAIANLMAFTTWLLLPAAPPWYVIEHGCAVALDTAPSPAGLSRVDGHLGITYFAEFYGRSASVFGALPSMHCAYPALGLFSSWRYAGRGARALHIFYTAWMVLAAVYLVHHWVIDTVFGLAIAWTAVRAARFLFTGAPVASKGALA